MMEPLSNFAFNFNLRRYIVDKLKARLVEHRTKTGFKSKVASSKSR